MKSPRCEAGALVPLYAPFIGLLQWCAAQLIAYLDRKFASLEDIFATKEELHDLESWLMLRFRKIDEKFDALTGYLDKQTTEMKTFYQELAMTQGRVDRRERWHHAVADKLGMKLES